MLFGDRLFNAKTAWIAVWITHLHQYNVVWYWKHDSCLQVHVLQRTCKTSRIVCYQRPTSCCRQRKPIGQQITCFRPCQAVGALAEWESVGCSNHACLQAHGWPEKGSPSMSTGWICCAVDNNFMPQMCKEAVWNFIPGHQVSGLRLSLYRSLSQPCHNAQTPSGFPCNSSSIYRLCPDICSCYNRFSPGNLE